MINKVILGGRLVRNAELKFAQSGIAVANFTIAVNRYSKNKDEKADFINCVAFGKTAELISERTEKGGRVIVEGSIKTGSYENKEGRTIYTTDVNCNNVQIIDWAGEVKKEINFEDMQPADAGDIPF